MIKFLDLGANDGCSIKKIKSIMKEKNIMDYEIYSFEAVPFFTNIYPNMRVITFIFT